MTTTLKFFDHMRTKGSTPIDYAERVEKVIAAIQKINDKTPAVKTVLTDLQSLNEKIKRNVYNDNENIVDDIKEWYNSARKTLNPTFFEKIGLILAKIFPETFSITVQKSEQFSQFEASVTAEKPSV